MVAVKVYEKRLHRENVISESRHTYTYVNRVTRLGEFPHYWAVVFFGQIFENYRSSTNSWATFFHDTS
jgi:hypothetical protein